MVEIAPTKGKQLSLDIDSVSGSLSTSDSEQKRAIIQRYLDRAATEAQCSVNEYSPGKKKQKCFRSVPSGIAGNLFISQIPVKCCSIA